MKITVLDDYQNFLQTLPCFARLDGHVVASLTEHVRDPQALASRIAGSEALLLIRQRTPITRALIERLPQLRLISLSGPVPHIDMRACAEHGITVCSRIAPGGPSYATAELAWGLVLAAWRRIPQEGAHLRSGRWQSAAALGTTLRGKTLGIHGYGRIGALVAGYGRAFGMRVMAWGGEGSRANAAGDDVEFAPDADTFYAESDVVSLHLALTPHTRSAVTRELLARMKPTALFVNTSRAPLVERGALFEALKRGQPGAAALDVFDDEPAAPATEPLLSLPNVVATPHLGYVVREGLEAMFETMVEQVLAYDRGTPVNVVPAPV